MIKDESVGESRGDVGAVARANVSADGTYSREEVNVEARTET